MKKLTYYNIFCIAFGGIIGWGAFVLPGSLFLQKASITEVAVAFLLATVAILFVAASYCLNFKLSTDSGGEITSANYSFGRGHGFFCGWMIVLVYISIVALNISALPAVIRQISPELLTTAYLYTVEGWSIYLPDIMICTTAILFFCYTNTQAIKQVGRFQNVITSLLLLIIVILAVFALFNSANPVDFSGELRPSSVLTIFATAPWAYIGFNIIPQVKMDASISGRKAYFLMFFSIICGTAVYLLLTWITLIGTQGLQLGTDAPWLTGWAVNNILGRAGMMLVFAGIIAAVLAGVNAFLYGASRLLFVMGKSQFLPPWFTEEVNNVPKNAVLFVSLIAFFAPFFGRTVLSWIVDMTSVGATIGFLYTGLSGLKATPRHKWIDRLIHLATCVIAGLFLLLLLVPTVPGSLGMESYTALFIWLLLGAGFYFVGNSRQPLHSS